MTQARTILICDDEAHIRHIVAHKLQAAGLRVIEARNGAEALSLLDAQGTAWEGPSLVITDLQMPVMSGIELATALKKRPQTSGTPVLMLTARGYILSEEQVATTNIRQVIGKPFGVRQLVENVLAMLEKSGPGQASKQADSQADGRAAA